MRDSIIITLVRIAQKGNIVAKEEIIKLVRFTVDDLIEGHPRISSWNGYESLIQSVLRAIYAAIAIQDRFLGTYTRHLNMQGEV